MDGVMPNEVRDKLDGFPYDLKIDKWANGKGVNVTIFPETLDKHLSLLAGQNGASPYVMFCAECHSRSEFIGGDCPDRYWQISTRHGVIWANNRKHLIEIRDHLKLDRRPQGFIKLPGWMLASKNRDEMVKLINRALEIGPPKI